MAKRIFGIALVLLMMVPPLLCGAEAAKPSALPEKTVGSSTGDTGKTTVDQGKATGPQALPGWFYSDENDHEYLVLDKITVMDANHEFVKKMAKEKDRFIAVFVVTTHTEKGLGKAKETLRQGGLDPALLTDYDHTMTGVLFRLGAPPAGEASYAVMAHLCLDKGGYVIYDWRGDDPAAVQWKKLAGPDQPVMLTKLLEKVREIRPETR